MSELDDIVRSKQGLDRRRSIRIAAIAVLVLAAGGAVALRSSGGPVHAAAPPAFPPAQVTVSKPLQRMLGDRADFLGQFSAVDTLEVRAQVGGTLTEIHFTDGQIVHKGDLLFVIDPRPYQIKLAQATAQIRQAQARLALAGSELWRAQQLKKTDFGTGQSVDQRQADLQADQAALELANAQARDAALDLEYCQVRAPFTGRISAHRVAIGSLVSGSRGGTTGTTLLTTLVSLDPIHLDFDMSESDFLAYQADRAAHHSDAAPTVAIKLGSDKDYAHTGTLDFIDNALDRASGTIHARATVPNRDLSLYPGEFARLRVETAAPHPALLVPATAVVPDQSQHLLMTVSADNKVVPKIVTLGGNRGGLSIVTGGVSSNDTVIIDGLMHARPGAPVVPQTGAIRFDDRADTQD
ncbi:efflux RND transporter periplasmic adaptor subunit [Acetobacteraceae bacterium KSS8]|uniref:Efflux RND transporter periplasmic adaptor subunit n=1 Tax=Endosaccharibacter trunci TaxID=2812733 RepID=A0ABT1W961_9PROT|nr:efflux RND transporter periplasmic adaptor subunit [Acetobacteraceae bacterium KSS8]